MNYPEGLFLGLTPEEEPAIFDAQDVCWIIFTDGGNGDPVRWQNNIIIDTCKALGVEYAYDDSQDEVSVMEFLERYNGALDFRE